MSPLIVVLAVVLLGIVVLVVSAPLRRSRGSHEGAEHKSASPRDGSPSVDVRRDELEAARESKYREIRDCELDYRTGKLSREDYQATDGQLRVEALEILNRLEALEGG